MRRMEPVPRLFSDLAASCLASADRPWRRTSSSRPNRYPQRPYYRFYYQSLSRRSVTRQWVNRRRKTQRLRYLGGI